MILSMDHLAGYEGSVPAKLRTLSDTELDEQIACWQAEYARTTPSFQAYGLQRLLGEAGHEREHRRALRKGRAQFGHQALRTQDDMAPVTSPPTTEA